ncbi:hypothetical protein E4U53_004794 [Claviceps sorghi]|nr:hypothetical protein E4U53_004794 [Claviceps sorghi]
MDASWDDAHVLIGKRVIHIPKKSLTGSEDEGQREKEPEASSLVELLGQDLVQFCAHAARRDEVKDEELVTSC